MLSPLQKLLKNVGDLSKLIVAKAFKSCPKSSKLLNLDLLLKKNENLIIITIN